MTTVKLVVRDAASFKPTATSKRYSTRYIQGNPVGPGWASRTTTRSTASIMARSQLKARPE